MEGQEAKKNSPGAEFPRNCRFRDTNEGNSIAIVGFSGMMLWSCNVAAGLTPFDVAVVIVVSIGHCSMKNTDRERNAVHVLRQYKITKRQHQDRDLHQSHKQKIITSTTDYKSKKRDQKGPIKNSHGWFQGTHKLDQTDCDLCGGVLRER
ncbi:hypothetical protein YC2023_079320 [Brassica napus]